MNKVQIVEGELIDVPRRVKSVKLELRGAARVFTDMTVHKIECMRLVAKKKDAGNFWASLSMKRTPL